MFPHGIKSKVTAMARNTAAEESQPQEEAMKALIVAAREFARDEEGVTAIEYGLIAAAIAGVVALAFKNLGDTLTAAFTTIGTKITTAVGS
jgi:pilus assembly protein Flp/PilA